jgi:N-acetylglutamate synthase-like GNAT family acetyltransferase
MRLSFSLARPEQAEFLVQFVNAAYRGETSKRGWTTEADLLDGQRVDHEMIEEIIVEDDEVILIAHNTNDHEIVGCVHLTLCKPDGCHLGMLTVRPDLQNSGVGAEILKEAEAYARSYGCKKLTMGVLSSRRELIDWYQRRGWSLTGKKEPFPYGNPRFGIPKTKDLEFLILDKNL